VSQNGAPPYAAEAVKVSAHWLGPAPLRPSNIRAPGKVANCFAVESFVDELAAKAGVDPIAFRVRDLADPRGVEVIRRVAQLIGWQPRPSPAPIARGAPALGRGMAYIHYKNSETYVAIAMEVEVDRGTRRDRVRASAARTTAA
jgi:CO/xanthine dehydrogenase Mo-binding subunit